MTYDSPLYPDAFFHVYNHSNGTEKLFRDDGNYAYFLRKLTEYLNEIAEIYAYCLMPNHFHLLIRIKSLEALKAFYNQIPAKALHNLSEEEIDNQILENNSLQFSHFFNSYTKSFNKLYGRKGSLFMQNFKRKIVEDEGYFWQLVAYIHSNPVHHGFTNSIQNWRWSSYNSIFVDRDSFLFKTELLELFGGKETFIDYHNQHEKLLIMEGFEF